MRRGRSNQSIRGGRGRSRGTMTPKNDLKPRNRSQSRHTTLKISDKLAIVNDWSDSDDGEERPERRFVKVVNTLNPSHDNVSAFTR